MKRAFFTALASLWVGLLPGARGTYGSALTAGLAALWLAGGGGPLSGWPFLIFLAALALGAVWASQMALDLALFGPDKDPGRVVIDEAAGQMIALYGAAGLDWRLVAAFVLFRLYDIWKPFPIGDSQRAPGGWGIVLDDLLAGLAAWATLAGLDHLWGARLDAALR